MKSRLYVTALAAGVASFLAFSAGANASVVLIGDDALTFPTVDVNLPPSSTTPATIPPAVFEILPGGTFPGTALNPWQLSTTNPDGEFSVINAGGGIPTMATYTQNPGTTTFSILWGSADPYNSITFYTSDGATTMYTGSIFSDCCQSGIPTHDWALFGVNTLGETITSVVLADNGTAAFEYSNATFGGADSGATPLPAALSLFAGGLGLIGIVGGRRKRKNSPIALAA